MDVGRLYDGMLWFKTDRFSTSPPVVKLSLVQNQILRKRESRRHTSNLGPVEPEMVFSWVVEQYIQSNDSQYAMFSPMRVPTVTRNIEVAVLVALEYYTVIHISIRVNMDDIFIHARINTNTSNRLSDELSDSIDFPSTGSSAQVFDLIRLAMRSKLFPSGCKSTYSTVDPNLPVPLHSGMVLSRP
jgi:hypothetical protein